MKMLKRIKQNLREFFCDHFIDLFVGFLIGILLCVALGGVVNLATPTRAETVGTRDGDGLVYIDLLSYNKWVRQYDYRFHLDACDESFMYDVDASHIDRVSGDNFRIRLEYHIEFLANSRYTLMHYFEGCVGDDDIWMNGLTCNLYGVDADGFYHPLAQNVSFSSDGCPTFKFIFDTGSSSYHSVVAEFSGNAHEMFPNFVEGRLQSYFMWGELELDRIDYVLPSDDATDEDQLEVSTNIFENIKTIVGYIFDLPSKIASSLSSAFTTLSNNISGYFDNLISNLSSIIGGVKSAVTSVYDRLGEIMSSIVDLPRAIGEKVGEYFVGLAEDIAIAIWQGSPFGNYQEGNSSISPEIDDALNNGLETLPDIDGYVDFEKSGFASVFDAFYSVALFVGLMEIVAVIALIGLSLFK